MLRSIPFHAACHTECHMPCHITYHATPHSMPQHAMPHSIPRHAMPCHTHTHTQSKCRRLQFFYLISIYVVAKYFTLFSGVATLTRNDGSICFYKSKVLLSQEKSVNIRHLKVTHPGKLNCIRSIWLSVHISLHRKGTLIWVMLYTILIITYWFRFWSVAY